MVDKTAVKRVQMSIFPTEAELKAWNRLTRDEQLQNLRMDLEDDISSGDGLLTREQIREKAVARIAEARQ